MSIWIPYWIFSHNYCYPLSWEFPNELGIGCNVIDSHDTANFLAFLQQLRNTPDGSKMTISVATNIKPWLDSNGRPSENLSDFKNVLDFLTIMSYDISSNSSFGAGPSSALDDSCAPVRARIGSAKSAVASWTAAGFPKSQIVLGVPSYGHSFTILPGGSGQNTSTTLPMYPFYASGHVRGDKWDGFGNETDVCGIPQGSGGTYEYWGLIDRGFLNSDGSPQAGIKYRFDNCSKTVRFALDRKYKATPLMVLFPFSRSYITPRPGFMFHMMILSRFPTKGNTSVQLVSKALHCGKLGVITRTPYSIQSVSIITLW